MFISSCSQEDSNPMFETNSETHINNASIYFNVPNRIASSISNYIHEI